MVFQVYYISNFAKIQKLIQKTQAGRGDSVDLSPFSFVCASQSDANACYQMLN